MTDRELLEAAAKAAGLDGVWWEMYPGDWWLDMPPKGPDLPRRVWRPLTDDGDALRLAVTLRLDVVQFSAHVRVSGDDAQSDDCSELHDSDPYAATRRAIVRAAAAMAA